LSHPRAQTHPPIWSYLVVAVTLTADATIRDLAAQGYNIPVNWVTGYPNVPLYECWVDAIHNPDGPPNPKTLDTVYVDMGCPEHVD
jgi:hypothetical protein